MCKVEFTTNNHKKIWCGKGCSFMYRQIGKNITSNKDKQKLFRHEAYTYDFDSDKFYVTSLMNNNIFKK